MKLPRIPYWELLIGPWLSFGLGALLNFIVVAANGGQMPVLGPLGNNIPPDDWIHCPMTAASHLKFLADWIVINGLGVASPGDFLLWTWQLTWVPCLTAWGALTIKKHHDSELAKERDQWRIR